MSQSNFGQRSRIPTGGRICRPPAGGFCGMRDGMRGSMRGRGFTLIELLVVIGIIVILIGILIPTVSHVRTASRAASTQSLLVQLQGAIEQYYQDYRAYPGPLSNDVMYGFVGTGLLITDPNHISYPNGNALVGRVSGSENLVLGLLGGLRYDNAVIVGGNRSHIVYDPTIVGTGPRTLAYDFTGGGLTAKTNQAHNAYLENVADLSTQSINNDPNNPGHFKDGVGEASDSSIPEFVDRFSSPMPILYLRARVGAPAAFRYRPNANPLYSVISDANDVRLTGTAFVTGNGCQYDIAQIFGYVGSFTGSWPAMNPAPLDAQDLPQAAAPGVVRAIGEGKSAEYWHGPANMGPVDASGIQSANGIAPYHGLVSMTPYPMGNSGDPTGVTPAPAPAYFWNPAFGSLNPAAAFAAQRAQNQPRGKDAYILISPGPDRVYGTADDITSFGAVMP